MKKASNNPLWWVNNYRNGIMTDSTPYESLEQAKETTKEMVELTNQFMPEHLKLEQVGELEWQDGRQIPLIVRIEQSGDALLFVKSEWIAISANYTEDAPLDWWFIGFLYNLFGLDTSRLETFADQFYAEGLDKVIKGN